MEGQVNSSAKSPQKSAANFDWTQLESIPILDICQHFGIEVKQQGGRPWCKLRPNDDTPSTLLNLTSGSKHKANTFHDFGSGMSGNNITLACEMLGLDYLNEEGRNNAAAYLSDVFHIPTRENTISNRRGLTNREYAKIGLYGDMATKNFTFDLEHMSLDLIQKISETYAMPMNQLKEKHPRTYERLLKTIAIPYVREQSNSYYMDVWMTREAVERSKAKGELVFQNKSFEEDRKALQSAEEILARAMSGTSLKVSSSRAYAPEVVLEKIDGGELKPAFGKQTYNQMQRLAKANKTDVWYRTLDLYAVYYAEDDVFGNLPYSAFFKDGKAVIGYLKKDIDAFRPIFHALEAPNHTHTRNNNSLEGKLQDAKQRHEGQCTVSHGATFLEPHR